MRGKRRLWRVENITKSTIIHDEIKCKSVV